jgi:hypothetical protein
MLLPCINFVLGGWGHAFAASSMVSPLLLLIWGVFLFTVPYIELDKWWLCHHFPIPVTLFYV